MAVFIKPQLVETKEPDYQRINSKAYNKCFNTNFTSNCFYWGFVDLESNSRAIKELIAPHHSSARP